MKAVVANHPLPVARPRGKPRLAGTRATLAALGAGFLALLGVHDH